MFQTKLYYERDNRGTRQDTEEDALAYWLRERPGLKERPPFVLYKFKSYYDAEKALLTLPFIHKAADTGRLICDRIMAFGCYLSSSGFYEALIAGSDLSLQEFQAIEYVFQMNGGILKNHLEPSASNKNSNYSSGNKMSVRFKEKYTKGNFTYEIYQANSRADAQAFLGDRVVTQKFYYVVVETPEGNFGRDNVGMYQE